MNDNAEHGRLYWLIVNSGKRLSECFHEHSSFIIVTAIAALPVVFVVRSVLHPLLLAIANQIYFVGVLFLFFVFVRWLAKGTSVASRIFLAVVTVVAAFVTFNYGWEVKEYLTLYSTYRSLDIVELDELPVSDFERIQPEDSVYSLAHEVMTETEAPSRPDFVRIGEEYRWTLAVEPSYPLARLFGSIADIFNLPGTAASPGFQNENRVKVKFPVGEHLLLSHNSLNSTVRNFGVLRFLRYEPGEVLFLPNDSGEWMQVISLVRWRGLMFPSPQFGGVQLIGQGEDDIRSVVRRSLFGSGEWITASEVPGHKFLTGQSLVSRTVSRFIAQSFRFQNGFFAPFPFFHQGDVRIPDLRVDAIEQPFIGFFRIPGEPGRLYHYFALEPYDPDKQGLNTSLFIPADGSSKVFIYRHYAKQGSLTGVTAISSKIMESRKEYDWGRNRPAEHRPFIKEIDGIKHFFWLTTVVTLKQGVRQGDFIAGSVPEVVLTDATYNRPVWVDPLHPEKWVDQLKVELADVWKKSIVDTTKASTDVKPSPSDPLLTTDGVPPPEVVMVPDGDGQ